LLAGDSDAGIEGVMERLMNTADLYTKANDGLITDRIDGLGEQVDSIDLRILDMGRRIDKFEENLRTEFATLELLVSGLQQQGAQMAAMLGG
ncbi:MAG: flagellar filament capping protein FliD, partial [Myxococcales bacterium]|nr:flagellar filament capping protein FliD [Myxococcales bacterium]